MTLILFDASLSFGNTTTIILHPPKVLSSLANVLSLENHAGVMDCVLDSVTKEERPLPEKVLARAIDERYDSANVGLSIVQGFLLRQCFTRFARFLGGACCTQCFLDLLSRPLRA